MFSLQRMRFGRNIVAIGSNELSAVYSVPVNRFKIAVYIISGVLCSGRHYFYRPVRLYPAAGRGWDTDEFHSCSCN